MKTSRQAGLGPAITIVNDRHAPLHPERAEPVDYAEIDAIIERYRDLRPAEALVLILQDMQRAHRYIPEPAMRLISQRMDLPMVQIYGVASFYQDFSMQPRARYPINVCEGISCYVRGADALRQAIRRHLGIDYEESTPDGLFGVNRADYCYGCCQIGPVVEINHQFYAHMTPEKLVALVDRLAREHAAEATVPVESDRLRLPISMDAVDFEAVKPPPPEAIRSPAERTAEPPSRDPTHSAASPPVERAPTALSGDRVGEDATAHETQAAPEPPDPKTKRETQVE